MKNGWFQLPIATRDGQFIARYSENGLAELDFPSCDRRRRGNESQTLSLDESDGDSRRLLLVLAKIRAWHRVTESALQSILAGRMPKNFPPLDAAGTAFQQSVWQELRKIPLGQTKSYGEIAAKIGKPKAVRAVGSACGANPIPVLVPCHRVIAAHGKLGGFSGRLGWKCKLLSAEGVQFPD